MQLIACAEINAILTRLLDGLQHVLGERLAGLYLYGSLVTGDFNRETSDIDLLAATATDIGAGEFERLQQLHDGLVAQYPLWQDRIEIAYLSLAALQTFKTQTSRIAIMSPGEPFHFKEAGREYLLNWWVVREQGVALYGPPPAAFIAPVSREEFVQVVREHAQHWGEWIDDCRHRPGQAYAILTLCRALYVIACGEQVSKVRAARWAQGRYPQWAPLIHNALAWREAWREEGVDHEATFPETVRFVHFAIDRIAAGG